MCYHFQKKKLHFLLIEKMFPTGQYYYTSFPCLYPCPAFNFEVSQRNRFTHDEDEHLKRLVSLHNPPNWNEIAKYMRNRSPRQCRERYNNYLRPDLINGVWTEEEDILLNQLFEKHGPKWSLISQSFNGRSAVNIKNHHSSIVSQMSVKDRSNRFFKTKSSDFIKSTPDFFKANLETQPMGSCPIQNSIIASVSSEEVSKVDEEPKVEVKNQTVVQKPKEKEDKNEENMFMNFNFDQDEIYSIQLSMNNDDLIVF